MFMASYVVESAAIRVIVRRVWRLRHHAEAVKGAVAPSSVLALYRMWEHRTGALPGFTRRYGVSRLVYYETA